MHLKLLTLSILFFFFAGVSGAQSYNQRDSQGRKQGKWVETYPRSAVKIYEGTFENGKPVGLFKYWYESGKFQAKMIHQGKVTRAKIYHENGYLKGKGKYVDGEKDSIWLYYDPRGRLNTKEIYENGKLNGFRTIYFVDAFMQKDGSFKFVPGLISQKVEYKDGKRHGEWIEYFTDGKKKIMGEYKTGKLHGKVWYYRNDGKPDHMITYKDDKKHGWSIYIDENGAQKDKIYYKNGFKLEGKELKKELERLNQ